VTETASSLVWDYRDRVARAQAAATGGDSLYERDAADRLVRQVTTTPCARIDTIHLDHLDVIQSTIDGASMTTYRPYVTDAGEMIAELVAPDGGSAPAIQYALADPERSVALRLDAAGNLLDYEAYTPFGATAFAVTADPARLARKVERYDGERRDETTAASDFGRRLYAPWTGRWLSPDPTGPVDGLNLYAFVTGSPVTYRDATGRMKIHISDGNEIEVDLQKTITAIHDVAKLAFSTAASAPLKLETDEAGHLVTDTDGYPVYKIEKQGDLQRVWADARIQKTETKIVPKFRIEMSDAKYTLTPSNSDNTVHQVFAIGTGDSHKDPKYTHLKAADDEAGSARTLIRYFKGKERPTNIGSNQRSWNSNLVPVMAISEGERARIAPLLALIELYNVKYGEHHYFSGFQNPGYFVGAVKGGQKVLRDLHDWLQGGTNFDHDEALGRIKDSIQTFANAMISRKAAKAKADPNRVNPYQNVRDEDSFLNAFKHTLTKRFYPDALAQSTATTQPVVDRTPLPQPAPAKKNNQVQGTRQTRSNPAAKLVEGLEFGRTPAKTKGTDMATEQRTKKPRR